MKTNIIIFLIISCFTFCTNSNTGSLNLKKTDLPKGENNQSKLQFKKENICIVESNRFYGIDDFEKSYFVVKSKDGIQIAYKILNSYNNSNVVISKDYLAFVKPNNGYENFGWFNIKDGKGVELPKLKYITDRLKVKNKQYFIREINGDIEFLQNGKLKRRINYGNFILKKTNLDSLEYGLYKFKDGNLFLISNDGNKLESMKDGIFYIPSPGVGVLHKYRIKRIIGLIDSISNMVDLPEIIKLKEDNYR